MRKLSKRYADYVAKKSFKYVMNHKADFFRLGMMALTVLSTNDVCFAGEVNKTAAKGWDKVIKPVESLGDFVTGPLAYFAGAGGICAAAGGLIKGEYRDLVGKGLAVTGGSGLFIGAGEIMEEGTGCLM